MRDKRIHHLFVFYLLANVYMLINNGIFWDDWTIIKMEKTGLLQQFGENGLWILVYFHDAINDSSYSPMLYHWLSFIFLFGVFVCFYKILKQFKFSEISAFAIALLAMLLPYFETKNTVVCMPYTMFLFSFSLGLYLIFKFLNDRNKLRNFIMGIILLFFGFFLNSLLPTFLFTLTLYFLTKNNFSLTKIKENNFNTFLTYTGLVAVPFFFWFVKKNFFAIKGLYAATGYNVLKFDFKKLPDQYRRIFKENVIGLYDEFLAVFQNDIAFGLSLIIISIILLIYVLRNTRFKAERDKKMWYLLVIGLLLFFIGTYPYVTVNKLPSFSGFETRHQILLPLGTSFILYTLIIAIPFSFRKIIFILFTSIFITTTAGTNINFLRGTVKMEAIKQDFKKLNIAKKGVVFTEGFDGGFNATERPFTFYELNGISKAALRRQDLFLVSRKDYKRMQNSLPLLLSHAIKFNMKDVTDTVNEDSKLDVIYNRNRIDYTDVLSYTFLYYCDETKYYREIDKILTVRFK